MDNILSLPQPISLKIDDVRRGGPDVESVVTDLYVKLREARRRRQPEMVVPPQALLLEVLLERAEFRIAPRLNPKQRSICIELRKRGQAECRDGVEKYLQHERQGMVVATVFMTQQKRIERRVELKRWSAKDVQKHACLRIDLTGNESCHWERTSGKKHLY